MRHAAFFCTALALLGAPASAGFYPALTGDGAARTVSVYSAIDEAISGPLISAFQAANPDVAVRYEELLTLDIFERVVRETDEGGRTADVAISSAMDLQVKLANDGYAQAVDVPAADALPDWAVWRDTAFALTFEPAVIVYHRPSLGGVEPPQSHGALMRFLDEAGDTIYGRVGTYDVERAGLGFLFLARDEEHYRDIWELVRALGAVGVRVFSNSSTILQSVADGRLVLGYNILGSYATWWADREPDLGIVLPSDYTIVMSRIGLVPRAAAAPDLGARFLDFVMSEAGQTVLANELRLPAIHPGVEGENTIAAMQEAAGPQLRPVPVSPALLVYFDQVKRARLIDRWNAALRAQ